MKKTNNRRSLHSSPQFILRLKRLQAKIKMNTGLDISLTELTDRINKSQSFEQVERELLNPNQLNPFKVRFD